MVLPQKKTETALGREVDWTEEEMDEILEVRPADLIEAQQLVAESVLPPFDDILDAEDDDSDQPS